MNNQKQTPMGKDGAPATGRSQGMSLSTSELLQAAFDSTETVRFLVKEDGMIIHFNRKAYENSILIHKRELKNGDSLFDFAGDARNDVATKLRKDMKRVFAGETFVTESEIIYESGSRWFQTEYLPVIVNKKIVAASISNDEITEKKKVALAREQLIIELQSAGDTRLQQIEFMLETMARNIEAITQEGSLLNSSMSAKINRLSADLAGLRGKVSYWKQLGLTNIDYRGS